jgi:hypothetical protein
MIPYQDWIARGNAVCDAECAEAMGWARVKGYAPGDGDWWWRNPGSIRDGDPVIPVADWLPTMDRNATAMLVEKVTEDKARTIRLLDVLGNEIDQEAAHAFGGMYAAAHCPIALIKAPASLLAYCCWRSLKEEA